MNGIFSINNSIDFKKGILAVIVFFSFFPDLGFKFVTFGFNWTAYRLIVLLCFVLVVHKNQGLVDIRRNTYAERWLLLLSLWAVYGIVSMAISPYSELHGGTVEIISLCYGAIVIYVLSDVVCSRENIILLTKVLFWILNINVLIAFIEIIFGYHFHGSAFYNESSNFFQAQFAFATGLMYNANDFSALITCLSPVLIFSDLGKKRLVTLACVLIINHINDANICNMAIIAFLAFYLLILNNVSGRYSRFKKTIFWVFLLAGILFVACYGIERLGDKGGLFRTLSSQLYYFGNSRGSLFSRVEIYKSAIKSTLDSCFLGVGPKGFSNYLIENNQVVDLVNPHSLLLEILSQYGLLIFSGFIYLLGNTFYKAYRYYNCNMSISERKRLLAIMAFIITYVVASFSPSNFLGFSYQWVIIFMVCAMLDNKINDGGII